MKTEIYNRAVELQKRIELFKKTIAALEEEFNCSPQRDIEDEGEMDQAALKIIDGLEAKKKTLQGIFANL